MKQYCPNCGEWYDVYVNVCPECDVLMYDEDDYYDCNENENELKIISLHLVNGLKNWGWLMPIVGIIGTFLSLVFSTDADTIWGTWIIPIVWFIILVTGIVFVLKSKKLCKGKKLTTLDRTSLVIVSELASGKIGKQWHNHNCDSDF